jgi:aminoglycoside phosphotransferase (APT) family kinase protein
MANQDHNREAPPTNSATDTDSDGVPAPQFNDPELIVPRDDEQLSLERLEPWLREHLEGAEGELSLAQFRGGRANLTYLLRFGASEYVLRRPPLGPIAQGAHDMGREHRVLSRLWRHFELAPRCYLHCTDETVIGAQFQIMERREGQVIRRKIPATYASDPQCLRGIADMLIDVLVALHSVDREQADLASLGHAPGFVERQLEGWAKRWYAATDEDNSDMDRLLQWLRAHLPTSAHVALLHNDFKLDNVLLDAGNPCRAVAILDWDMCTSGDPMMDLGYLMNQWVETGDDREDIAMSTLPSHIAGFPDRAYAIERYASATGIDVAAIDWYHSFAAMKFAAVVQQIYIRFARGQTLDSRFAGYGERARANIRKGLKVAGLTPTTSPPSGTEA